MTNRLLLQAGAVARREDYSYVQRPTRAAALLNAIPVFEAPSGLLYRAPLNIVGGVSDQNMFVDATQTMPQLRASLSYVAGAHEFKTGFANQGVSYDDNKSDNNYGFSYTFNSGVPIALTERAVPFSSHQRSPLGLGVYAQDKWTIKKLTLNGGVRFEWYKTNYPDHYFGPGPLVPTRSFAVPGADYYDVKDVAPRVGAAYDLFDNGKTALKASANRYVGSLTGANFFAGNPIQRLANQATRAWNDRFHPAGDPRRRGQQARRADRESDFHHARIGGRQRRHRPVVRFLRPRNLPVIRRPLRDDDVRCSAASERDQYPAVDRVRWRRDAPFPRWDRCFSR